ncbi:MAG: DUF3656 domain-containing protein [Spirochaetales bacterium]|nr:DUF3656 domain-containing protein [Spirochaetales bacterium]
MTFDKKPCELVAPAGSFTTAIIALENGADAVYAGLESFSARKYAKNLSLHELRRVIRFAHDHDKKVFIALNTIIKENEIREIISLLYDLSALGVDGIILQDLGLLDIIRTHFPGLRIHASTQLCVYNKEGVAVLKELGVKRVVLARELTMNEIREIRDAHPDMELEVFIHGALCYSYSGLCLASGMLLNRSGNRGECAQICRTWFEKGPDKGYYFSCNDLMFRENVSKLLDMGIDAFKIEGRMKSPSYVSHLCRYYKSLLTKQKQSADQELTSSTLIFSRNPTNGFFSSPKPGDIINTTYPSHMGIKLGEVEKVSKEGFSLLLNRDIELHDGLLFFSGSSINDHVLFGIQKMIKNGKSVYSAKKGEYVLICHHILPETGSAIFQVSSKKTQQPELPEGEIPLYRIPCRITLFLYDHKVDVTISINNAHLFEVTLPFHVERADKEFPAFEKIAGEFNRPGESLFWVEQLTITNKTAYPDTRLFIPPSLIKKTRREVLEIIGKNYAETKEAFCHRISLWIDTLLSQLSGPPEPDLRVPRRALIKGSTTIVPFINESDEIDISDFYHYEGTWFGALAPVIMKNENLCEKLLKFFSLYRENRFVLGLNNISHLALLSSLEHLPNLFFFTDFFLYCGNRVSLAFLLRSHVLLRNSFQNSRKILFSYFWIEGDNEAYKAVSGLPGISDSILKRTGPGFNPPLFVSRICFMKHACSAEFSKEFSLECPDCPGYFEDVLRQGNTRFKVIVRNCLTYVFAEKESLKQTGIS